MSCFRSTIIIAILALTTISNNISSSNAFKATYNINNYRTTKRTKTSLDAIGIFFGTSTGSTQEAADLISAEFGDDASEPIDIEEVESVANEFAKYDSLIVGTPTWNTGEIILCLLRMICTLFALHWCKYILKGNLKNNLY